MNSSDKLNSDYNGDAEINASEEKDLPANSEVEPDVEDMIAEDLSENSETENDDFENPLEALQASIHNLEIIYKEDYDAEKVLNNLTLEKKEIEEILFALDGRDLATAYDLLINFYECLNFRLTYLSTLIDDSEIKTHCKVTMLIRNEIINLLINTKIISKLECGPLKTSLGILQDLLRLKNGSDSDILFDYYKNKFPEVDDIRHSYFPFYQYHITNDSGINIMRQGMGVFVEFVKRMMLPLDQLSNYRCFDHISISIGYLLFLHESKMQIELNFLTSIFKSIDAHELERVYFAFFKSVFMLNIYNSFATELGELFKIYLSIVFENVPQNEVASKKLQVINPLLEIALSFGQYSFLEMVLMYLDIPVSKIAKILQIEYAPGLIVGRDCFHNAIPETDVSDNCKVIIQAIATTSYAFNILIGHAKVLFEDEKLLIMQQSYGSIRDPFLKQLLLTYQLRVIKDSLKSVLILQPHMYQEIDRTNTRILESLPHLSLDLLGNQLIALVIANIQYLDNTLLMKIYLKEVSEKLCQMLQSDPKETCHDLITLLQRNHQSIGNELLPLLQMSYRIFGSQLFHFLLMNPENGDVKFKALLQVNHYQADNERTAFSQINLSKKKSRAICLTQLNYDSFYEELLYLLKERPIPVLRELIKLLQINPDQVGSKLSSVQQLNNADIGKALLHLLQTNPGQIGTELSSLLQINPRQINDNSLFSFLPSISMMQFKQQIELQITQSLNLINIYSDVIQFFSKYVGYVNQKYLLGYMLRNSDTEQISTANEPEQRPTLNAVQLITPGAGIQISWPNTVDELLSEPHLNEPVLALKRDEPISGPSDIFKLMNKTNDNPLLYLKRREIGRSRKDLFFVLSREIQKKEENIPRKRKLNAIENTGENMEEKNIDQCKRLAL